MGLSVVFSRLHAIRRRQSCDAKGNEGTVAVCIVQGFGVSPQGAIEQCAATKAKSETTGGSSRAAMADDSLAASPAAAPAAKERAEISDDAARQVLLLHCMQLLSMLKPEVRARHAVNEAVLRMNHA